LKNESLLSLLGEVVNERAVYNHLLGEASVDACLLVSIQVFLIKCLHAVVKALSRSVEKILGAGLEVDEVVTFHLSFIL
jgi:hypothetical protein